MQNSNADFVRLGTVREGLVARNTKLKTTFDVLAPFDNDEVLLVSVPYGETLIEEGRFQWDLLGRENAKQMRAEYGDVPIPLGLVTSKVLELFAPVPGQPHRNLPLYLVPEGKFFGLFENYAPNGVQSKLGGTAGATTLMVAPLIGDGSVIAKFTKSLKWKSDSTLHQDVKRSKKSPLAFGRFFEELLHKVGSTWRMEFIVFPRALVDAIDAHCPARSTMRQLTLDQLAVAHVRAESTLAMLSKHERATDADALAVRQIAHGFRPGFVPVFGTADDERQLPAAELEALLYAKPDGLFTDWTDGKDKDEDAPRYDFFPAVFRPSFGNEDSFYFLKRAYGPEVETATDVRKSDLERAIKRIAKEEVDLYTPLDLAEMRALLEKRLQLAKPGANRAVAIGRTPFIECGVIFVQRVPDTK